MTLLEETLNIDTPENVSFGYDVADIGSRFLAALVDTLLIIVLQAIVNLTLLFLTTILFGDTLTGDNNLALWLWAAAGLVGFAFLWGYYIFFELLWNGQSPGKRWVGLRVIRTDGTPITLVESIIRNLVRLVDFLPASYGVGVVAMFINEQARRLGDLAAGTLVVRDRADVTLDSLAAGASASVRPPSASFVAMNLPIERLTDQDILMAEEFLRRRDDLANRSNLARRLMQGFFKRMDTPLPKLSGIEVERLLTDIVGAHQNHQSRRQL